MIETLIRDIKLANEAYRVGKPIMSDSQYDILIDELSQLDPDNDLLNQVGHFISDETRKSRLPIEMASMNKIKSMEDIYDWCRLKGIPKSEFVIITPKFDGLSLCVNERTDEAFTRGDGEFGQRSDEHYKLIGNHLHSNTHRDLLRSFDFTYGEVMMSKSIFIEKYSQDFANPRNLVAGLLNSKEVSEPLKDTYFIKYGAITNKEYSTKQDLIEALNACQSIEVKYHICKISDLTEELLINLFHSFGTEYEIDGLIIEINDLELQSRLGRETSSKNPVWARAFKHPSFEQSAETEVIGITWNISKQGYLKPILHIKPVRLDGVTVSNVTGNNARFVKDMGLGVGAKVIVRRSGMVIPIIADVIKPVEFLMPDIPNIGWNENGVELMTLTETDEQRFKQAVSFFEILEVDNVGEGIIRILWNSGYKSIKDILNIQKSDLEKIEGFGKRKSSIIFDSIRKSVSEVDLEKIMHGSGFFPGLGTKKLKNLTHFKSKPLLKDILEIEGFAEKSAQIFIDGYDHFYDFLNELSITIKQESKPSSNDLDRISFCFTGFRRGDIENIIQDRGGKISTSVSKNLTYLVCSDKSSGSSKLTKAHSLGINIIDLGDLYKLLGI